MAMILLLDNDPVDRAAIQEAVADAERCLVETDGLDDFLDRLKDGHVELAIISLAAVCENTMPKLQRVLLQTPETKILALTPVQGGDGLATLLKAESLRAHHLLAKPIDRQQLQTILNVMFPLPSQQD